jgi:hypothetical protein
MLRGFAVAPAMQAIIVDGVPIVDPQLTAIIGDNAEPVVARSEDSQAACPTHCEVITSSEARPLAACVAIVHCMAPASHVWSATNQVLASPTLSKVEDVFPEETMTICGSMRTCLHATCTHNMPTVSSIATSVPEQHTSVSTVLKHLQLYKMPSSSLMPIGLPIAPTVQAIIIDRVAIVNPQLASIIGVNAEPIMTRPENS